MTTIAVPLSKLALSPLNVRQTTDADDTSDLEGSIIAHGLLAPLAAHPMARGKYGVIAGGRRLRALQALAERGEIDGKAYQVDVVLRDVADADATEISIIENTARVALPVVEEVRAFAKLAEAGDDPAAIARRFGTTELHVRQRMRLGQLHPDILSGLERGQITQDAAKAFAATTDHAAQKRAWDAGARAATEVKAAMRRDLVNAGADRMLELVGLDAYVAAGGVADEDLFTPGEIRLRDVDVLKRLYDARLTEELADLALPANVTVQFTAEGVGALVEVDGELSDAQWERLQAIERELLTIELKMERIAEYDGDGVIARWKALPGGDQDEVDRLVAERVKLEREGEQIKEGSLGGVEGPTIAVANIRGGALGITGHYRPYGWRPGTVSTSVPAATAIPRAAGSPTPAPATPAAGAPAADRAAATAPAREKPVADGFRTDRAGMSHLYTQPEDLAREQHGLTRDAVEAMRSHHRSILGGALATGVIEQRLAASGLVFVMARGMLRQAHADEPFHRTYAPIETRLGVAHLPRHAHDPVAMREELDAHPAAARQRALVEQVQAAEWMREADDARAFRLFTRASHIDRERAAAAVFIAMLARSLGVPGFAIGVHDVIAELLDVGHRVRSLWSPDARFFERLPKAQKIAALEAVDPKLAKRLGGLAAEALTEATAAVMSGSREAADKYGMDAAAIGRAKAWVPPYLSFREPEPVDDDPDDEDDDANVEEVDVTKVGGAPDIATAVAPDAPDDAAVEPQPNSCDEAAKIPRTAYMAELRKDVSVIAGERAEVTLSMVERELPAHWQAQKPSRVTLAKALTGLGWRKVERPGSGARYARPAEIAA